MAGFEAFVAERYLRTRKKGAFVRVMVRFARCGIDNFIGEDRSGQAVAAILIGQVGGDAPDLPAADGAAIEGDRGVLDRIGLSHRLRHRTGIDGKRCLSRTRVD